MSYDDVGLAARMLARLPDVGDRALPALAWALVNMWREMHKGEFRVKFPLLLVTEHLLEHCEATHLLAKSVEAVARWRAVSAVAGALAREGDDPTLGAVLFHHGASAPDWALGREDAKWIGKWAFHPP